MAYHPGRVTALPLSEALLQSAVIEHLRAYGDPQWLWWHTPNEGKRSAITGAHLKRQGMRAGVGDLSLLHQGRYYELELKTAKGRLQDAQRERQNAVLAAGGMAEVTFGLDDALAVLKSWGALR